MRRILSILAIAAAACLWCGAGQAAHKWNLKEGTPDLKSAGQLTFGPDGILFVGDSKGAALFAIDTGDAQGDAASAPRNIEKLHEKLSALYGSAKVTVNDLAVNAKSGNVYLSIGAGDEAKPVLVKIDADNKLTEVSLAKVPFLKATIPNPPEDKITGEGPRARNRRNEAITDLAYVEGKVLVSGATSGAASSTVLQVPFPFADTESGTNIEIYHGAHGKLEDTATIRTFVPFNINGEASLLAGFTCTPLVRFPLESLEAGKKVRGTTVAELGNRNMPLDMIVYEKGGEKFLLMANNNRGVMKVSTQEIGRKDGIEAPVGGGGTAGQKYETIESLAGTVQLDRLGDSQAIIILASGDNLTLKTVALP